jgi:tRNA A-37 threonylcarbamoyl transferase component Bud32
MQRSQSSSKLKSSVTKKLTSVVIDPDHIETAHIPLVAYLYQSYYGPYSDENLYADFQANSSFWKSSYKVQYPDTNENIRLIEQSIKLSKPITVCPITEINPLDLNQTHLYWLANVLSVEGNIRHYHANEIYLACLPNKFHSGTRLQRPLKFTQTLIMQDMVVIDPSNLNFNTEKSLYHLIKINPLLNFFDALDFQTNKRKKYEIIFIEHGFPNTFVYQQVCLTALLIRFTRKKNPANYRLAVCASSSAANGNEGCVYFSNGTIKLEEAGLEKAVYKVKENDKKRAVKILMHVKDEKGELIRNEQWQLVDTRHQDEKAIKEFKFLRRISFFHAKLPALSHDNQRAAVIMRRAPGKELFEYLSREASGEIMFSVEQRLRLSIMICDSVIHNYHRNKIIHRDIKPENIIVKLNDAHDPTSVVVLDVGLAKDAGVFCKMLCGTPEYVAPEIYDRVQASEFSDAWSTGTVLHNIWGSLDQLRHADLKPGLRRNLAGIIEMLCWFEPIYRTGLPEATQQLKSILTQHIDDLKVCTPLPTIKL